MRNRVRRKPKRSVPVSWLPIDSRLFSPLVSFGHVKGLARLFLEVEIFLSLLVVLGTMILVVFSLQTTR